MTHEHLPAVQGGHNPCFNCPPIPGEAPMHKLIVVGFGAAVCTCDGKLVLDGEAAWENDEPPTFQDAENLALADPDHDWRISLHGPMHGEVYQRQSASKWVLIQRDEGFA